MERKRKPIVREAKITKHFHRPMSKPPPCAGLISGYLSTFHALYWSGLSQGSTQPCGKYLLIPELACCKTRVRLQVLSSNSLTTRASRAYLMGDRYWNQLIQSGMFWGFANCPPNNISGMTTIGASAVTVSSLLKMLDMKQPKEAAVWVSNSRIKQKQKNCGAVIIRPILKYTITANIIGEMIRRGVSVVILARQQEVTSYMLFACSLRNTGLSGQNVMMVPIMLAMVKFTTTKKRLPIKLRAQE